MWARTGLALMVSYFGGYEGELIKNSFEARRLLSDLSLSSLGDIQLREIMSRRSGVGF